MYKMIKKLVISFIMLFGIFDVIYSSDTLMNLYPIKKRLEGKFVEYEVCFIDYNGKLVIPFEYSWGSVFENGVAAVTKNKQDILIDINNKVKKVFPGKYHLLNGFSEGLCIIRDSETGLYGFINYNGEIEIPIEYTHVEDFSNGTAKVYKEKVTFYINKKNEKILQKKEIKNIEYEIFIDEKTKLEGLKKIDGEILIPAEYQNLWLPTVYGLCVFTKDSDDPTYGVINTNNEIIYPGDTFYEIHEFKNGMAVFSPRNNQGGYLREDGKVFYFKNY